MKACFYSMAAAADSFRSRTAVPASWALREGTNRSSTMFDSGVCPGELWMPTRTGPLVVAFRTLLASLLLMPVLAGCDYARLARPSVLSELTPPVARLVNELPDLDAPNKAIVAQLYAVGGLAHAEERPDGSMHVDVVVPPHRMMWQPAVIDMPHGGALELRFSNHDQAFHAAYLPSDGGQQLLELPVHEGGVARIELDQPGLYWFGCPVADHVGRGMLGLIIVRGAVPQQARLDRPPQRQPGS
jgi:PQQ system protein